MAREYARVKIKIWADPDFRKLSDGAQALYFRLITSPTMNLAGVADWRPKRLAALTEGVTAEDVTRNAEELRRGGYVIPDDETEEILVRTFVRHDGLIKTPNIAAAMVKDYAGVASATLRGVIVHELYRLHEDEPDMSGWVVAKDLLSHAAMDPSPMASDNPSEMALPIPSGNESHIPHPSSLNQQPASPRSRKAPATRMPKDWQPTDAHRTKADELGADLKREAEAFRLHAEANDRRVVRWNAAFSQWLLNSRPSETPRTPADDWTSRPSRPYRFHDEDEGGAA